MVIGTHILLGHPDITEMFSEAGFDAIWIDMEYTAIDKKDTLLNIMATAGTDAAPFVRISWNDPVIAKPILDMGAEGIVFPYIRSAEEAEKAVQACLYPPDGIRGFGPLRAVKYGKIDTMDYIHERSRDIWKIIQIEHIDAVNDLDRILAVEGISAIIIGPCDLSGSLGLLGQTMHPKAKGCYENVAKKCKHANIPFGVSTGYDPNRKEQIDYWIELGVNLLFLGGMRRLS